MSLIQGVSTLLSLPITYVLIVNLDVLGEAIGLAVGNILIFMIIFQWNRFNRERYLDVDYEWKRISRFVLLFSCFSSYITSLREQL